MSLEVCRHATAEAFAAAAEPWLLQAEAEHNLLLGLIPRLAQPDHGYQPPVYLATIEQDGEAVGCAFRTPPFKLGLTGMPGEALPLLADNLADVYDAVPAVFGPESVVRPFAALWAERKGVTTRAGMRQRIYQLDTVTFPQQPPPGVLRGAEVEDSHLVEDWTRAFIAEAGAPVRDARRRVEELVGQRTMWLWEDGAPRCMVAKVGGTPNGARVGYVYTPPELRTRGYASAAVAALSQRILDSGRTFCFLYTDLSNPTSNAIYQRLGYRPVCDVVDYDFGA